MSLSTGGSGASTSDPFSLAPSSPCSWLPPLIRAFLALPLSLSVLGACAAATGSSPPGEPPSGEPTRAPAERAAPADVPAGVTAVLGLLDSLTASGAAPRAARVADSAYFRWRSRDGGRGAALRALSARAAALTSAGRPVDAAEVLEELLRVDPPAPAGTVEDAARRLAELRSELGLEPGVLRLLARYRNAWSGGDRRDLVGRAASSLSTAELAAAVDLFPPGSPEASIVRVELSRALALTGRRDSARRVAERALTGDLPAELAQVAGRVRMGGLGPSDRGELQVGAILPLSGSLAPIGRLLEEGLEIAVKELRATGDSALVRIEVRDDSSDVGRAAALARDLEAGGAVAILGPVRSRALAAAARERRDRGLALVSPTATDVPERTWNAYTLWARETRRRAAAEAVSGWLTSQAGLREFGVLRPQTSAGVEAELDFRAGVRKGGGYVVAATSFSPDSTTFESAVRPLAARDPEAAYLPLSDTRTVLQLAPQLSFYGLRTTLLAGDVTWGEPVLVRRLGGDVPSHWVTALFVERGPGSAWSSFQKKYEMNFDKRLSDNMLAPLAYDAAELILRAVRQVGLPRHGAVARALAGTPVDARAASRGSPTSMTRGVTGALEVTRGRSAVRRVAEVRVVGPGGVEAADPDAVRSWMRQAVELRDARRRRHQRQADRRVERWVEEQEEQDRNEEQQEEGGGS